MNHADKDMKDEMMLNNPVIRHLNLVFIINHNPMKVPIISQIPNHDKIIFSKILTLRKITTNNCIFFKIIHPKVSDIQQESIIHNNIC